MALRFELTVGCRRTLRWAEVLLHHHRILVLFFCLCGAEAEAAAAAACLNDWLYTKRSFVKYQH